MRFHSGTPVVLLLSSMLLGCVATSLERVQEVPFATLSQSLNSGIDRFAAEVVRDNASLERLWQEHVKNDGKKLRVPVVDFSHDMVIAVFLGPRSNGCYQVQIERVIHAGGVLKVEYREIAPFGNAICTYGMTWPSHIVRVPARDREVEFVRIGYRSSE
ncbi:MAG TPA: protease complex subunit PrcB family protein [Noviherbaspirillum sp.]|uniref:protease complex subunit PrcB family protein n=1 Tax=Noviherbaspirillum sp. TaxID=1926288 RepID=UPI002D38ED78|nr:protease complex subunit PrcB family protein [Noviherbaspirillum sp.]HYD94937.1 protease complex subunit PrcB family protein [Noviherbaspirillum sp.]